MPDVNKKCCQPLVENIYITITFELTTEQVVVCVRRAYLPALTDKGSDRDDCVRTCFLLFSRVCLSLGLLAERFGLNISDW